MKPTLMHMIEAQRRLEELMDAHKVTNFVTRLAIRNRFLDLIKQNGCVMVRSWPTHVTVEPLHRP